VGKTIVITGAGVGLGRALARRFAKDGDTVILLGRTLAKVQTLAEELGAPAVAVECDVASPDSVRAAFAEVARTHPRIDVLINNAGVYEPFEIEKATDAQIDGIISINLLGPIYCARAVIPMMGPGGYIINVSSDSVGNDLPLMGVYQASKAGLERFSHTLYKELKPKGIRVSTVRAGPMYEEGKIPTWEPAVAMQFHQECTARGINLATQGVSHVDSVAPVFRALIDLPPDVQIPTTHIEGWPVAR
jgi:meso-butanediol dehydrogenase / (S,S)-butanediol dehydrogenase / diacetyl reductase